MLVVILKYGIIEILIMVIVEITVVIVAMEAIAEGEMIIEEKLDQRVNQPPTITIAPRANNATNQLIPHKGMITTLH